MSVEMDEPTWTGLEVTLKPQKGDPVKYMLDAAKVRLEPYRNPGDTKDRHILHVSGMVGKATVGITTEINEIRSALAEGRPVVAGFTTHTSGPAPQAPVSQTPASQVVTPNGMLPLYEAWKNCTRCPLHENRKQVVFGSGNTVDPRMLVLGEAPGVEEERQGIPFIGPTGMKLRQALQRAGVDADNDAFITNSVICFPRASKTDDKFRAPTAEEMLTCRPRLSGQFEILTGSGKLKGVLLVGKRAYLTFFQRASLEAGGYKREEDFEKFGMRNALGWYPGVLPWPDVKVMTVYHPSYFMRQKWADTHPEPVAWRLDIQAFASWCLKGEFANPRVR